jgi:hypothetical protein
VKRIEKEASRGEKQGFHIPCFLEKIQQMSFEYYLPIGHTHTYIDRYFELHKDDLQYFADENTAKDDEDDEYDELPPLLSLEEEVKEEEMLKGDK